MSVAVGVPAAGSTNVKPHAGVDVTGVRFRQCSSQNRHSGSPYFCDQRRDCFEALTVYAEFTVSG